MSGIADSNQSSFSIDVVAKQTDIRFTETGGKFEVVGPARDYSHPSIVRPLMYTCHSG